jgi:hypothetical protein
MAPMFPRSCALLMLAPLVAACTSATAPSPPPAWFSSLPQWSPFVVVQPDDGALNGYRDALAQLTSRRAVAGARIQLFADGRSSPTVSLATSMRVEVLGIVDNMDLLSPDLEGTFDRYRSAYPQVRMFQIGNEVTTGAMPMSIDRYLDIFARIYAHVVSAYPDVTLVTQAAFGAGVTGSSDLTATIDRLRPYAAPPRVILALNAYTQTAIMAYEAVLRASPPPYRIFVTETGIADPASEIAYVMQTYPRLLALPAERIYWYALWAGDTGVDSGYSLISRAATPPIVPGPLFQLLTQ